MAKSYEEFVREADRDLGRVSELNLLPDTSDMVRERAAQLPRNADRVRLARFIAWQRSRDYSA